MPLSLIYCWSQLSPESFGSKNGSVLSFYENFKTQNAEDSYPHPHEQETGEEFAAIFQKPLIKVRYKLKCTSSEMASCLKDESPSVVGSCHHSFCSSPSCM